MPRGPRITVPDGMYHITSRGNNREVIFREEADCEKYLALLQRYREKYEFSLYSYSILPNHFHVLIQTTEAGPISKIMHGMDTAYAMYVNRKYDRCGHVFQDRFHGSLVDSDEYFLEVMRYIDMNPVRAGLVKRPEDYRWSSHRHHALGEPNELIDHHDLYENLGDSAAERQDVYRTFVRQRMEEEAAEHEALLETLLFVGSEDFVTRILARYGQKIQSRYRAVVNQLREFRKARSTG